MNLKFKWPLDKPFRISSKFGPRKRPCPGAFKNHSGIDIACPIDTPGSPIFQGTVAVVATKTHEGLTLIVDHGLDEEGANWRSAYCHLNKVFVKEGGTVYSYQVAYATGNTGISSGPHLHVTIRRNGITIDPLLYLKQP